MFTVFISESSFSSLRLKKRKIVKENGINLAWWWSGNSDSSINRTGWPKLRPIGQYFRSWDDDDFEYQELYRLKLEAWYRRKGDRKLEPEMNLKIF